jgi:hypothetical protein
LTTSTLIVFVTFSGSLAFDSLQAHEKTLLGEFDSFDFVNSGHVMN